jgi:hypothetical protein
MMNKRQIIPGPTQEQQDKLKYLESLGLSVDSYNLQNGNCYATWSDDYEYRIDTDDFEIGDPLYKIEKYADIYSCCGDLLDRNYIMCPSCKEHC